MSLSRNIAANYIGRAYSIGAIYLFVPFYVSILGVAAYGLIALYAVILALTALADVGMSATFSRQAAVASEDPSLLDLLTTIERILAGLTLMVSLALFIGAPWIAQRWLNSTASLPVEQVVLCIRLMAISLPPQLLISLYSSGLLGLQRQVGANVLQAGYTTLRSGLVIVPISLNPQPSVFFAWHLVITVCTALVARLVLLRAMGHPSFAVGTFAPRRMRHLLKFAAGMFAITIITSINTQLDKLIVSKIFSISDFGYYTLGGTLAQLPVSATTPIALALFPAMAALISKGADRESATLYERYSFAISLLASLGAVGLAVFAPEIFDIWLVGKQVPPAALSVASFLALGSLFLCLQLMPYYLSIAHNDNWTIAALATGTLMLSIPLAWFGATRYGLPGAAIPWIALNLLNFAMLSFAINRRYYGASHMHWLLRYVTLPVAIGTLAMVLARLLSNSTGAGHYAAIAIAALFAGGAVLLGWRIQFRDPGPISAQGKRT